MRKLLILVLIAGGIGVGVYHIVTQTKERRINLKYLDARQAYALQGDYDKAFALLTELVAMNHPLAPYELGVMYEKGQGTPADLEKATSLYRQAHPPLLKEAQKNDDSALSYLGEMYLNGRGVAVDKEEARSYFLRIKHHMLQDYVQDKVAETRL